MKKSAKQITTALAGAGAALALYKTYDDYQKARATTGDVQSGYNKAAVGFGITALVLGGLAIAVNMKKR